MAIKNKLPLISFMFFVLCFLLEARDLKKEKISDRVVFENMNWADDVGANKFPGKEKEYSVNNFGAVNDGETMNTKAIQKAIEECAANGGGKVVFERGEYLTGSVFIKSGVNFVINEGVTILGSQDIKDYPVIDTRVAGIEMKWPAALINIMGQENAAITGKGLVHAQGKPFWDLYWKMRKEEYEPKGLRWIVDYDCQRPRTVLVSESQDVTIENITLMQAGFWTVHILYSEYVTVDGIIVKNNVGGHGPSTDGIDIDSSEKILVKNCDIDCNDDNFCLKAGRDADGLRVNRPTRYVVIMDCISRRGGGLVTFGSETSGGISHVLAMNLEAKSTGTGIRFKSAKTRGGTVQDVYIQDMKLDSVKRPFVVTLDWNPTYSYSALPDGYHYDSIPKHWKTMLQKVEPPEKGIPKFKEIHIKNMVSTNSRIGIYANGLENSTLEDFRLENVKITANEAGLIDYGKNWVLEDVEIEAEDGSRVQIKNSTNINWEK